MVDISKFSQGMNEQLLKVSALYSKCSLLGKGHCLNLLVLKEPIDSPTTQKSLHPGSPTQTRDLTENSKTFCPHLLQVDHHIESEILTSNALDFD